MGLGFEGSGVGWGRGGGAFPRAVARGVFGTGSVFRDFSASAGEAFILVGSLGTGLSFYGVQTFS